MPAAAPVSTPLFDVKLCYPFIEAVCEILSTQCHMSAQVGSVGFKQDAQEHTDVAIVAALCGETSLSTISICFPKAVFLEAISLMLGERYSQVTAEVEDAAKELANLIFNQAKQRLVKKGVKAARSIPQILIGDGLRVRYLSRERTMALPVKTSIGAITIEITTQPLTISDQI